MPIERILVTLVGAFCLISSITNWDWFFNNPRAAFIAKVFRGRNGARLFYLMLGLLLLYIGIFLPFN
jgi:hypothetical protein